MLDAHLGGLSSAGSWETSGVPADSLALARVRTADGAPLADPVLSAGGRWQFREHCPLADGCLAVEHRGAGHVARAWPFRTGELAKAEPVDALPYKRTPGVDAGEVVVVDEVVAASNGDLLATLRYRDHVSPSSGGIVRVDSTGRVLWYRRDYSHGEPHIEGDSTIWTPSRQPPDSPAIQWPGQSQSQFCPATPLLDVVNVLDRDGRLTKQVSVAHALLDSPWAASLVWSIDACYPLHVNSVSLVGRDVSDLGEASAGDLVVSLHSLNAFAVLDRRTSAVLLYVRGTFAGQRSVKHLRGSKFIMFDGSGGWESHAGAFANYSRVLVVDAATGEERTVFPTNPRSFEAWKPRGRGRVSISPDRLRALASHAGRARAVEVRIEDGTVLAQFEAVHDVRGLQAFAGAGSVRFLDGSAFLYARQRADGEVHDDDDPARPRR